LGECVRVVDYQDRHFLILLLILDEDLRVSAKRTRRAVGVFHGVAKPEGVIHRYRCEEIQIFKCLSITARGRYCCQASRSRERDLTGWHHAQRECCVGAQTLVVVELTTRFFCEWNKAFVAGAVGIADENRLEVCGQGLAFGQERVLRYGQGVPAVVLTG